MVLFYSKFANSPRFLSVWDLKRGGRGGSFVFRKAWFIIKRAQFWDALVTWVVIRESCAQAGNKLNPQFKSPLCSERRTILKGS